MINYKIKKKYHIEKELISKTCDICNKIYTDVFDMQEFFYINSTGGFGSKFGDCETIEADICDSCMYEFLKGKYRVVE